MKTTKFIRVAFLLITVWCAPFCSQPVGTAFGQVAHFDFNELDPATQEKVEAALTKLKESPSDVSAVEELLAIEPRVAETVGTSEVFCSNAPVKSQALKWIQALRPVEVLVPSLERGSDAAVHWALRQIVFRKHNGWFDKESLARLKPGIEMALAKPPPKTRAQAVRTMMVCLPEEEQKGFLKGLLKEQPDEVMAAAVEEFANELRESDPEVEVLVAKWLGTSDDPVLLRSCCMYWWLVKSRSALDVKAEEIGAFERLAGHRDATVRHYVALAVSAVATPDRPRIVGILLRLTQDKDSSVNWQAVRSLRNANTPEVNARLRELFQPDQPQQIRPAAIEVLGIFGKDNLPLILNAAKGDKNPGVRGNAFYALRKIGTPEAGEGLEAALLDPDKEVRRGGTEQLEWFRKEHPR